MYKTCFLGAAVVAWLLCAPLVHADDVSLLDQGMALGDDPIMVEHDDQSPFKGYLHLEVTNTGDESWGDFHFEIYHVPGQGAIDNVDWVDDSPYEPTSSQGGLSWVIDNVAVGATLDLYFYSDPVAPGETATFDVYTDNTTDKVFFGVLMYPSPVPEPGTLILMGIAGMCLYYPRRRR